MTVNTTAQNIAYVRVSTKEQNTARQFANFEKQGLVISKVFEEKISGKDSNRPQLKAMLEYIRQGDCVYVESLSRLARSTRDLLNITAVIEEKGANLISLKENIDTSTPQGRLIFTVFSAIAQFERECIKERQQEGIEIAKAQGKMGRPSAVISDTFADHYRAWKQGDITAKAFMDAEGLKRATFYRLVKKYENR